MLPARLDAVLLDLDGVVYVEHTLVPGAAAAIAELRRRGIRVLFGTNNATWTRKDFALRLTRMGIPCAQADIMNTAVTAARWLKKKLPRGSRVGVFGNRGLAAELRMAGLVPLWAHTRAAFKAQRARDPKIRAVAVAFDQNLTYWDLCASHLALQRGALLVACNRDVTWPVQGHLLPGTGSLVKLLETAWGGSSILLGKPAPELFRALLVENRISPRRTLVVGDRLEIDAAAGKALGTSTALVLTGVDTRADARRSKITPDLILDGLPDLLRLPALRGRD